MKKSILLATLIASVSVPALAASNFNRIASFPVYKNNMEAKETSSEIIDVTADGMTLVYTDSPNGTVGMIDITDPANPKALGSLEVGGEPTAVVIQGQTAYVGVNTSESYTKPSGNVAVIDIKAKKIVKTCDVGGQPDSLAGAKDDSFISIAIENERDEDLNDGVIPQLPAGNVVMFNTSANDIDCGSIKVADVTGLADVAPTDPEPEFVDINNLGETVVSLQENNHMVVLDKDGKVVSHFSAGAVDLENIDATDERAALIFNESQMGRLREPDAVKWIDDNHFATANEGDYEGGSRGWTIFHKDGTVVYESGVSFEHELVKIGHYPDKRSDSKGVEPESIETANFNGTPIVFVGSERGSAVGVYDVTDLANPKLLQILPSGIGPEGYVAIPERNLLVSANEVDLGEDNAARSHVMLFELQDKPAVYPHLTSAGMDELTGWGAISGMVADEDGMIYAVNDSFYGYQPTIFKIDPSQTPARIIDAIGITRKGRPAQKLDLEGITLDGEGNFFVVSEGRTGRMIPHGIYHVTASGEIAKEIPFPKELLAIERRHASEGITKVGDTLWVAIQREWDGVPKNHVILASYNLETEEWGAVLYPKAEPKTGWVGLSEITAHGDHVYIIERDNQIGENAVTKKIYKVALDQMKPASLDTPMESMPVVVKEEVRDLIPDLTSTGGYVVDKVEGLAVLPSGEFFVSTDNDGVDDSSGETMFFSVGKL